MRSTHNKRSFHFLHGTPAMIIFYTTMIRSHYYDGFIPYTSPFDSCHNLTDIFIQLFQFGIITGCIMSRHMSDMVKGIIYNIYQCRLPVFYIINSITDCSRTVFLHFKHMFIIIQG